MPIFVRKKWFWPFSSKNRSLLGWKKNLTVIFFVEITKKCEKLLDQMKVGMLLGKVKKLWIGWWIPQRMAADNAEGGVCAETPPPASNRVKKFIFLGWDQIENKGLLRSSHL
jgi:hypothetical protein